MRGTLSSAEVPQARATSILEDWERETQTRRDLWEGGRKPGNLSQDPPRALFLFFVSLEASAEECVWYVIVWVNSSGRKVLKMWKRLFQNKWIFYQTDRDTYVAELYGWYHKYIHKILRLPFYILLITMLNNSVAWSNWWPKLSFYLSTLVHQTATSILRVGLMLKLPDYLLWHCRESISCLEIITWRVKKLNGNQKGIAWLTTNKRIFHLPSKI